MQTDADLPSLASRRTDQFGVIEWTDQPDEQIFRIVKSKIKLPTT